MDETTFENQGVLRDIRKCRKDTDIQCITVYCLVAIAERRLRLDISTYMLLRILSLSLFEKLPLMMLFEENGEENYQNDTQLNLNFF